MLAILKAFPSISSLLAVVVVVTLFKQKTRSYLMLTLLLFVIKFKKVFHKLFCLNSSDILSEIYIFSGTKINMSVLRNTVVY